MISVFVAVFTLLVAAIINGIFGMNTVTIIVVIAVHFLVNSYVVLKNSKMSLMGNYIVFGSVMRIALLFLDRYGQSVFRLPNSGADSEMFYMQSVMLATEGRFTRNDGFIVLMGNLMRLIGTSRLLAQYVVVMFSIISLVYIAYSLNEIPIAQERKQLIMLVISMLPNYAILGSIFLRESIVAMLISMSCYNYVHWLNNKQEKYFVIAIIQVLIASYFHSGAIGMIGGYIAIRLIYNKNTDKINLSIRNILATVIFILLFTLVFNRYSDTLFRKLSGVNSIEDIANTNDLGGSSYARYVGNSNSLFNMIIYTPLRLIYFLFSPFPWQWRNAADIIAFIFSSMFFMFIIYKAIRALRHLETTEHKTRLFLTLIIVISVVFVFAWGVSNTGTAARHRDKLVPLFAILWAFTEIDIDINKSDDKRTTSKYIR